MLQIDRQAANVAIRAEKKRAYSADCCPVRSCPMPFEGPVGRFYLDNLRAHIGQILHGRRPLQVVAEADRLHSVEERSLHSRLF
jgi:hypothetical protein